MRLFKFSGPADRVFFTGKTFVFSNATECELDKQGRILIPPPLREGARISKSVIVVGILNKMEIWDKGAWDTRKSQTGDKIGEVLSTLGL